MIFRWRCLGKSRLRIECDDKDLEREGVGLSQFRFRHFCRYCEKTLRSVIEDSAEGLRRHWLRHCTYFRSTHDAAVVLDGITNYVYPDLTRRGNGPFHVIGCSEENEDILFLEDHENMLCICFFIFYSCDFLV